MMNEKKEGFHSIRLTILGHFSTIPPMMSESRSLSDQDRFDWLRLSRSENVGPLTFVRLLERYGTAKAALAALPTLAKRGGRSITVCSVAAVEAEIAEARRLGCFLLASCEPAYPRCLAATDDAPPLLYARGNVSLLKRPTVAMVGARNASANGRVFTRRLASDLGQAGMVVVSGLARGIDTAAHQGALSTGTVAVLAGGVDIVYPPENAELYQEIVTMGCVVSEMPPGIQPQARHFPRRNRIISGLSLGVVVIEASLKSGSMITARLALEQGREIFSVPGHPMDGRAQGTNQLLRDGATLVEKAEDVLESLKHMSEPDLGEPAPRSVFTSPPPEPSPAELDRARKQVLEYLSATPTVVDSIIRECQLSASTVSLVLLELELAGRLERQTGNRVALLLSSHTLS